MITIKEGLRPLSSSCRSKEEGEVATEREPMTPAGYQALKERLHRLKEEEMPKISREIGRARELGDLSETAEYHAAKDKQGLLAAQIRDLEDKMARAEVIDPGRLSGTRVIFGATVTLEDTDSGERMTIQIVGQDEADTKFNKISYSAPLARALIGREEDDEVIVTTPRGKKEYRLLKVEYLPQG
jgi:transcription elongation factor GreA